MNPVTRREQTAYFVLADDGLLYQNPAISGQGWAFLYDHDEGGAVLEISSAVLSPRCKDPVTAGRKIMRGFVPVVADLDSKRQVRLDHRQHPPAWIFPLAVLAPLPSRYMRTGAGRRQPFGPPYIVESFSRAWG
jgi:hypothetical protein